MRGAAVFELPDIITVVFPLPGLIRWLLQLHVVTFGIYYWLRGVDRLVDFGCFPIYLSGCRRCMDWRGSAVYSKW